MALPVAPTQFGLTPELSTATGHRTAKETTDLPGPFDREVGRVTSMYLWGHGRPELTEAARRRTRYYQDLVECCCPVVEWNDYGALWNAVLQRGRVAP